MLEVKRTAAGNYGQHWSAYNAAQTNEKSLFLKLLYELCQGIEEPESGAEHLRLPLRDMLFCLVFKAYTTFSSRRFMCDPRDMKDQGWISVVPHFNSLLKYQRSAWLQPLLQQLIRESGAPLRAIENRFAVDSTGLRVPLRRRHYNRHKERFQMKHDWVKLHAMCGVQTNIITSAEVSKGEAADSPFFQGLVRDTARYFELSAVFADGGYTSNSNRREVLIWGAEPYIAFKSNSVLDGEPKSTLWKRMLQQFQDKESEFWQHYYNRNNIEATFSMLKRKFGDKLRSKTFPAQVNEALCLVLCHNLCVIIKAMYTLEIKPDFHADAEIRQPAHAMSAQQLTKVRERLAALTMKQPALWEFVENSEPSQPQAESANNKDSALPAAPKMLKKSPKKKQEHTQVELFSKSPRHS